MYVRVRGWNRRSADALIGFVWVHCSTEFGQLLTYTDDLRMATVQQLRTFSANENDPEGPSLFIYYAVLYRLDMQISPSMSETNI